MVSSPTSPSYLCTNPSVWWSGVLRRIRFPCPSLRTSHPSQLFFLLVSFPRRCHPSRLSVDSYSCCGQKCGEKRPRWPSRCHARNVAQLQRAVAALLWLLHSASAILHRNGQLQREHPHPKGRVPSTVAAEILKITLRSANLRFQWYAVKAFFNKRWQRV